MSAEEYNKKRRILFSTANNPAKGFTAAFEYLEGYKPKLGPRSYAGLRAELMFYQRYRKEFSLTVAGDMGEHADFAGVYDGTATRFDITTNIDYKKFSEYEPFMGSGVNYKIGVFDKINYEIVDVLELAFKRCECGGFLIPFLLLRDTNYSSDGESSWTNDQSLMHICSSCQDFDETERMSYSFFYSPEEFGRSLPEDMPAAEQRSAIDAYALRNYKFFRRSHYEMLMGVAGHEYVTTRRDGDGYWTFKFGFKNQAIADHLPDDIDCGLV